MKILQTLHWTQFAGTEKVCVDLCNEMSKNHKVILLSNKDITQYLSDGVKFLQFDFNKNRFNPLFLYKTAKLVEKIAPDIIHCHNAKELEIMSYMQLFLKNKIKILATLHNPELKTKFKLADISVAVSPETMDYMNAKKNILITNGAIKKEPKLIKKEKFTILGVGRLAPVKGWDLLIEALSRVNFDFELIILGEGNEKENLKNLSQKLNIADKVNLAGFVDNVADYVYSCDLQVIASETEGLSISLIEAIFYAKTLIASNVSNHKDILGNDLVFDRKVEILSEKLNEIYENHKKFTKIFAKVKQNWSAEFSIEKMAQKYIKAYEIVVNKK
ncbi:MAG: glycosyltransferase [Campylobacter sp.]|nr:glycosyltransferase [Campylobacter sp.]